MRWQSFSGLDSRPGVYLGAGLVDRSQGTSTPRQVSMGDNSMRSLFNRNVANSQSKGLLNRAVSPVVEGLEKRSLLTSVTSATFNWDSNPQSLVVTFNDNGLANQLDVDDIVFSDLSGNTTIDRENLDLDYL
jgi:hypothetical protein